MADMKARNPASAELLFVEVIIQVIRIGSGQSSMRQSSLWKN